MIQATLYQILHVGAASVCATLMYWSYWQELFVTITVCVAAIYFAPRRMRLILCFHIVRIIHQQVILFLVLAPFWSNSKTLLSHVIFQWIVRLHWRFTENQCILTHIENSIELELYGTIVTPSSVSHWIEDDRTLVWILNVLAFLSTVHFAHLLLA